MVSLGDQPPPQSGGRAKHSDVEELLADGQMCLTRVENKCVRFRGLRGNSPCKWEDIHRRLTVDKHTGVVIEDMLEPQIVRYDLRFEKLKDGPRDITTYFYWWPSETAVSDHDTAAPARISNLPVRLSRDAAILAYRDCIDSLVFDDSGWGTLSLPAIEDLCSEVALFAPSIKWFHVRAYNGCIGGVGLHLLHPSQTSLACC